MKSSEFLNQSKAMNQLQTKTFPLTVYHGTTENFIASILENGLKPRSWIANSLNIAKSYGFSKIHTSLHYRRNKEEYEAVDLTTLPKIYVLTMSIPDASYIEWSKRNAFNVTTKVILPRYFNAIDYFDYAPEYRRIYKKN
jgi:hypothetical protein